MGFVLARKHARVLRIVALICSVLLPLLALLASTQGAHGSGPFAIAAAVMLLGAVLERWLFFAEARHVVMRYRSEEHTSELQSLMRISYAVFCLKKKKN